MNVINISLLIEYVIRVGRRNINKYWIKNNRIYSSFTTLKK
jgi:hypothetical protein